MKGEVLGSKILRFEIAALLLLAVVVAVIRIKYLPSYPYFEDEIISIDVMKSIASTGEPLTSTGLIYWRALVAHYLMAIPLLFAPVSPISTRLICVLFSLLVMGVAYFAGRSLGGRWGGWLAFLFLGASSFQNWHAAMARFYMPFQFFFILAVYLAGVYFVEKKAGAGKWLVAALVAAIGSHHFSLQLIPICVLGVLIGHSWSLCRNRQVVYGGALIAASVVLFLVWMPANAHTGEGAFPLALGGMGDKFAFYTQLKKYLPFGLTLMILALIPAGFGRQQRLWRYYLGGFAISFVALSLLAPDHSSRYFAHLFPLAVIIAAATIGWLVENIRVPKISQSKVVLAICTIIIALAGWHLMVQEKFNLHQAVGNTVKFNDQKPAHEIIARYLRPGDLVMSTEPGLTGFYLKRQTDYWLREDYDPQTKSYRPFAETIKQEKIDFYVDSPEKLREILRNNKTRIVLYGNEKLERFISPEMSTIVQYGFIPLYYGHKSYVFVAQ